MISLELSEINKRVQSDPRGFLAECDVELEGKIAQAAASIATTAALNPIILLAGPSGSGKTTVAGKIAKALGYIGINTHVVSMDDYFLTVNMETHPKDKNGNIDFESPDCLDIPLLSHHFSVLASGGEIQLPVFDFLSQSRSPHPGAILSIGKDEAVIFEGIHALNPSLLNQGGGLVGVYASARSSIRDGSNVLLKSTWLRLLRRIIRDDNFRGYPPDKTVKLWASIRQGEKLFISPYKHLARITINTTLAYEPSALCIPSSKIFSAPPDDVERADELRLMIERLKLFTPIDERILSKKSLLREFIGHSPVVLD